MKKLSQPDTDQIVELWNAGKTPREIIDKCGLEISTRHIQRIGAKHGNWRKRWIGRMERRGEQVGRRT